MKKIRFSLNISAEQYLDYYQGVAKSVQVRADDGRSVNFPASELQKFVTHEGVKGRFEIEFDENFKLIKFSRL